MGMPTVSSFRNLPGGGIVAAMDAINSLSHNMLKRKYYPADIQSQINNRNASTEGQQIANKYMPEKLGLENVFSGLRNQYYGPNIQSEIDSRNALTEGQKFKNSNPLMNMPGSAGQIGSLIYLAKLKKEDPQAYDDMMERGVYPGQNQQPEQNPAPIQNMQPSPDMQGSNSYLPSINQNQPPAPAPQSSGSGLFDPINLLKKLLTPSAKISPTAQKALDIAEIQAGFVPGTGKTQRLPPDVQKSLLEQLKKEEHPKHTQLYNAKQELEEARSVYGKDSQEAKEAQDYVHRISKGANESSEKNAKGYAWMKAPINLKNHMLAQAAGMGIEPSEAERQFTEGKTVSEMAKENGFNPNNLPQPDYLPNNGNITKLKERQAALAELNSLKDFTTKNLKPYSKTFLGFSPKQIVDSSLGRNKPQLINFLAARALAQEENLVRLTVANAKGTIPAIKSLSEKAMGDIKTFRSLVDEDVFEGARNKIDAELGKALKAAAKSYNPGSARRDEGDNINHVNKIDTSKYDVPEGWVSLFKKGQQYFFPPHKVDEMIHKGFAYER